VKSKPEEFRKQIFLSKQNIDNPAAILSSLSAGLHSLIRTHYVAVAAVDFFYEHCSSYCMLEPDVIHA
jgi:hypothetical protein